MHRVVKRATRRYAMKPRAPAEYRPAEGRRHCRQGGGEVLMRRGPTRAPSGPYDNPRSLKFQNRSWDEVREACRVKQHIIDQALAADEAPTLVEPQISAGANAPAEAV